MKNYTFKYFLFILLILGLFIFYSCKNRELNYIDYYHKVYAIDSARRVDKDTLASIRQYKKLFRRYPPAQNERLEEYETYIKFADKYHENFGGKKSLNKLIAQVAPYWGADKRKDAEFFKVYKKYGIDSIGVERKILQWEKGLNKVLVDSFNIAFERDQHDRHIRQTVQMNDKKNAALLLWTLKNYGYPSLQKMGLLGENHTLMSMGTLLNHMANTKHYEYFKTKLLEYVKSGECTPRDYIEMVDKYQYMNNRETLYNIYVQSSEWNLNAADSARIDRNRRAVGFPGMKLSAKMVKDFFDKMKKK